MTTPRRTLGTGPGGQQQPEQWQGPRLLPAERIVAEVQPAEVGEEVTVQPVQRGRRPLGHRGA